MNAASGYGESERNIGELNNNKFQIITKISPFLRILTLKKLRNG